MEANLEDPQFWDSDDEEFDMDEEESDDDEIGSRDLRTRFLAATAAMKQAHRNFSKPEALYDFLYEFRDVVSESTEDLGTLLHVAVELVRNETDVRSANMVPLIQNLLKEHPHLLKTRNKECRTPLYMAVWSRKSLLVDSMIHGCSEHPEWRSAVQDALEIPCARDQNMACLHQAFEKKLHHKTIESLMGFAKDGAFAMQDATGKTPLHHAVEYSQCNEARVRIIRLIIQRDNMIRKARNTAQPVVETFLDIVDGKGRSVYRYHLESAEKFQDLQRYKQKAHSTETRKPIDLEKPRKPQGMIRRSDGGPHTSEGSSTIENLRKSRYGDSAAGPARFSSRLTPLKGQDEEPGELSKSPRSDKGLEAKPKRATEKKEQRTKADPESMAKCSKLLLDELQLHYMRTRNITMAVSFLYGKNLNGQ
ncbi:hypothetical protein NM208_g7350 [Fusarium decemcellulare]|uniref:Uncharacterized protein n=1 Tax=Fusarium decemcellulare TaxID=57161 RepID=A0ACC1S9K3_9HYPO|nr:hypothetical protein NM208_g7350 [Fusarium decemcellulare]